MRTGEKSDTSQSGEEDTVSEHESDVELSEMDSGSEHDSCEDESD